jgi:hypothetical protein
MSCLQFLICIHRLGENKYERIECGDLKGSGRVLEKVKEDLKNTRAEN